GWRQVGPDLESIEFDKKLKGEKLERWQSLQAELKQFDALKPAPLPTAFAATDIGRLPPSTTIPGDRQKRVIPPGFLTVLQPQLQTSVLEIEPRSSFALAI